MIISSILSILNKKRWYNQVLNTTEWKNKRLEILKRDNYKCIYCGSNKYLNMHHTYYMHGLNPWEYPNDSLITNLLSIGISLTK